MSERKPSQSAGIEYVFTGSDWTHEDKQAYIQRLPRIFSLVRIALQNLGVFDESLPRVLLERVTGVRKHPAGICYNGDTYLVSVKDNHLSGDAYATLQSHTQVNVHESMHAFRHRVCSSDDAFELAATEGIACFAHEATMQSFFSADTGIREAVEEWGEVKLDRKFQQFISEVESVNYRAVRERWFEETHVGYILGLWRVDCLIGEGASLTEIIQMPTADVLGVA
ncbi:hypothetical protein KC973_04025 [Candidatus Saccharibacteria bacterium]|nr:hypothetical protein [Candidatus Saccharibacteria bacterium]